MRGILGTKVGMTQVITDDHEFVAVTVIRVEGCRVAQVKTRDANGYGAAQLCLGQKRKNQITKAEAGHADKHGIEVPRHIVEIEIDAEDEYEQGQSVEADIFAAGDIVDVVGVSKGKGHAGVMKRHNFSGLKASHGTHRVHRHGGAIGMAATPARVLPGMRMSGHLGHERSTVQNLEIVDADPDTGLLLVKGAVPGPKKGLVMVKDAAKGKRRAEQASDDVGGGDS